MIRLASEGNEEVRRSLDALVIAGSARAQANNIRTLVTFALAEVKKRTPGSGKLRDAWQARTETRTLGGGVTEAEATIFNARAQEDLSYTSAYDGQRRPRLKQDGGILKYKDIIPILDKGSAPHAIFPRRAKRLIFNWSKATTNPVFARRVDHPGTRAYGMITETRERLDRAAENAGREIVDGLITTWERGSGASLGPLIPGGLT